MILTVTPEPDNLPPRVKIEVDSGSADALENLRILRDGASIRQVPASGFASVVAYDYELPRGVDVRYTATATVDEDEDSAEATTRVDSVDGWMIHPRYPELSVAVHRFGEPVWIQSFGRRSRSAQAMQHAILGSSMPVTTTGGPRRADARTMQIVSSTDDAAQSLENLFLDETPVLFRFPPDWEVDFTEGFYAVGDLDDDRPSGIDPTTVWTVPLQLVRAPASTVVAEWSWADLIAEYPTWQDVLDAFPTWYAVLTNQPE